MRRERNASATIAYPIKQPTERHQSLITDLRFTAICASPAVPIAHHDDRSPPIWRSHMAAPRPSPRRPRQTLAPSGTC